MRSATVGSCAAIELVRENGSVPDDDGKESKTSAKQWSGFGQKRWKLNPAAPPPAIGTQHRTMHDAVPPVTVASTSDQPTVSKPKKRGRPRSVSGEPIARAIFQRNIETFKQVAGVTIKEVLGALGSETFEKSTYARVLKDSSSKYDPKADALAAACIKLLRADFDVLDFQHRVIPFDEMKSRRRSRP